MTKDQRWLSKKYLVYRVFTTMFFVEAVWLYFYRIFITDQQVGVLDGTAFAIGLIAEVPSGALADKFGRDRVVRLGQVLTGLGFFIQAFGSSFVPFFVGQAVMMIGVAFVSGADEALFFERLGFRRDSADWRRLVTRGSQVGLISLLVATVLGGWLHTINPRIPWFLTGATFILSAVMIWSVKDTRPRNARQKLAVEIKEYLQDIKTGFGQFRLPKLWLYVPIIIIVQGLFYAAGVGLLRLVLLGRFHFSPLSGSVVVASSSLVTVGLLTIMHKKAERISEKNVLTLISLLAAVSLLVAIPNIGMWGYFVILVLYAGEYILMPFMSEILNTHAPEDQRATVLSVGSFLRTLPYVIMAPIIGSLSTKGNLEYFLVGWAVLILIAVWIYLGHAKRDAQISIKESA